MAMFDRLLGKGPGGKQISQDPAVSTGREDGLRFINEQHHDPANPALIILRQKGYQLSMSFWVDTSGKRHELWKARGNGWKFSGPRPLELLGQVALVEARGAAWPTQPGEPDLLAEVRTSGTDMTDHNAD